MGGGAHLHPRSGLGPHLLLFRSHRRHARRPLEQALASLLPTQDDEAAQDSGSDDLQSDGPERSDSDGGGDSEAHLTPPSDLSSAAEGDADD